MSIEFWKPEEIEAENFRRISEELSDRLFPVGVDLIVKHVVHTTVGFSFVDTLFFSEGVVEQGKEAIWQGICIVTDINMALAGTNEARLAGFGATVCCFMAEADAAAEAKERGATRTTVSMERAAALSAERPLILAIGNAPTALVKIRELMDAGQLKPVLLIAAPVGFANVVEAKELFVGSSTLYIIVRGRKGGSIVATAIVNAIPYQIWGAPQRPEEPFLRRRTEGRKQIRVQISRRGKEAEEKPACLHRKTRVMSDGREIP